MRALVSTLMRATMWFLLLAVAACHHPARERPRPIPSSAVETTGAIAEALLSGHDFTWRSFATTHFRIHLAEGMNPARIDVIADSVENARRIVLALIDEADVDGEEPVELFLVETRDDMRRLIGDPVTGNGYPSELTAVLVAGDGYRAFYRHMLTHTYVPHRWGRRRGGSWLDEGLATRATGTCQGHAIDAIAAGYTRSKDGDAISLTLLAGAAFDTLPELPSYYTAASLVDFLQHRKGTAAVRALWRGETLEVTPENPLGPETNTIWSAWRRHLAAVPPATLDEPWLRQDGC
jgi:hypothetical protein